MPYVKHNAATIYKNTSSVLQVALLRDGRAFFPADEDEPWTVIFTAKADRDDTDEAAIIAKTDVAGMTVDGSLAMVELVPDDTDGVTASMLYCGIKAQRVSDGWVEMVADFKLTLKTANPIGLVPAVPIHTTQPATLNPMAYTSSATNPNVPEYVGVRFGLLNGDGDAVPAISMIRDHGQDPNLVWTDGVSASLVIDDDDIWTLSLDDGGYVATVQGVNRFSPKGLTGWTVSPGTGQPVLDDTVPNFTQLGRLFMSSTDGSWWKANGTLWELDPTITNAMVAQAVLESPSTIRTSLGLGVISEVVSNDYQISLDDDFPNPVVGDEVLIFLVSQSGTGVLTADPGIRLPTDSSQYPTLSKALVQDLVYIIKLQYSGSFWMLTSLVGGY